MGTVIPAIRHEAYRAYSLRETNAVIGVNLDFKKWRDPGHGEHGAYNVKEWYRVSATSSKAE